MPPTSFRRRLARLALPIALATLSSCTDDPAPTAPGQGAVPRAVTASALVTTVTNTNNDGPGSLREAIELIAVDGGTIEFADAIGGQTITLQSPIIVADKSLTIAGSAAEGMTLSGGGTTFVVLVTSNGALVLRNLTITGGRSVGGGGGILNGGTLTLDHSTVTGNRVLEGSDLGTRGGGIYSEGSVLITNSTVSGNHSDEVGGGIAIHGPSATLTVENSTIAFNDANGRGGGFVISGGASATFAGTIVANNSATSPFEDCYYPLVGSIEFVGENFVSTFACITSAGALMADPRLAPLADNGGPTPTHALLPGSPAIEGALTCTSLYDQRYVLRPQGRTCDVGAFEFTDFPAIGLKIDASGPVNPNTGAAIVSGTMTCPVPGTYTLQVELTQNQKIGRLDAVARASASSTLSCDGTRVWSIALLPPSGGFKNGPGTASAKTLPGSDPTTPYTVPGAATGEVKLYWGRK